VSPRRRPRRRQCEALRILFLTQLFQPEPNLLKGLTFARSLQAGGHTVQVLTGFPNYPGGTIYPGYSIGAWYRERMDGIDVVRVPHYFSHSRSGARRILSYLSFAASAAVLGAGLVKRPDVIHVYQGPASLMIPAAAISWLRGGRIVLDVQDLWPESVTGSGMLKTRALERALASFCRWTYRRASRIVVLSQGFKDQLVRIGVPAGKVDVVYNWCDEDSLKRESGATPGEETAALPDGCFSLLYAGSLGALQGLSAVIDAAALLKRSHPHVRIVFVGDGIEASAMRAQAQAQALENVIFVPRQPPTRVNRFLQRADALLIHLKDDPLSASAIPQKTQAYLAAGRPIVIAMRGEASELVERAGAGIRCRAGDPADIARAIAELAALPAESRDAMGRRGGEFYTAHLSFARGAASMARIFEEAAAADQ
jgi:colanic acid biosynthesis glycosyl transferase WcaI